MGFNYSFHGLKFGVFRFLFLLEQYEVTFQYLELMLATLLNDRYISIAYPCT